MAAEGNSRPKLGDVLPQTISDWQREYAKMTRQRDEMRVALDEIQTRAEVFIGDWLAVDSAYQPEDIQHLQQLYDLATEALDEMRRK